MAVNSESPGATEGGRSEYCRLRRAQVLGQGMRLLVLLMLAVVMLAVASCGESAPGVAGSAATSVPQLTPEEEALWDRASAAYRAADGESWGEMYAFTSPRSRGACDKNGSTARIENFAELFRNFLQLGDDAQLTFRVKEVGLGLEASASEASAPEGSVFMELHSNGSRVENGEITKFRWVFMEGEWWEEHKDWSDGCVGWKAF